ncbi:LytR/AlgR family response regulator transcription factor [Tenacibaculum amylolyticum]|uniref:LytR/AlgR family response regulator transcription factor n=1 Tax=Tenacibaculum amylolyticum TaxID=104269 RepID=UPI0038932E05
MPYKCVIVDDEPLATKLIANHIAKIDTLEVVAICNSAIKAFEVIHTTQVDLLFLDINMPNLTGIDFLKSLKNPPKAILTTAYRDYAIESYDLEVLDYLLKPITFERFFKAIEKFLRNSNTPDPVEKTAHTLSKEDDFLLIKSGNKHHKILIKNILYIESLKDYIQFHLEDDKRVVSKYKISDIENELKAKSFLRVHRSYLINTTKITAFTIHDIEIDTAVIPIGVSYKEHTMSFLEKMRT